MEKNMYEDDRTVEFYVRHLCQGCGSHERAAEYLGYSIRQYRDIRRKIKTGSILPARIENLIRAKARELQAAGACR